MEAGLYDSVTNRILNLIAVEDQKLVCWNERFTVSQDHFIPAWNYVDIPVTQAHLTKSMRCNKARSIIASLRYPPAIRQGYGRGYYQVEDDIIYIPDRQSFRSEEDLYATAFHELVHATGHPSRLNRKGVVDPLPDDPDAIARFKAPEEVLTELAATYLCAEAGILDDTIESSAAYIRDWAAELCPENTACPVVDAAPAARLACAYILHNRFNDSAQPHLLPLTAG